MRQARRTAVAVAACACALLPAAASAAACCTSATSFGVGRLLVWEDFAAGVQLGHVRSLGAWDSRGALRLYGADFADGLTRVEPWAIVRLHERVQAQARVPVLVNDREVGAASQVAAGLGDLGAGVRVEALSIGQFTQLPSLAFTLGALAPTGRRAEQALPPLGAGTTGRGAWAVSLALESEWTQLPWFVRLDAGVTVSMPFRRADTGLEQLYGPLVQAALSGGRELVPDRLVGALALQAEYEAPLRTAGALVPASQAWALGLSASLSWRVEPHWTLVTSLTSSVWPTGAGMNRDARLGLAVGVRYGYF